MYLVQIIYSSKYSSAFRNDPLLAFWGHFPRVLELLHYLWHRGWAKKKELTLFPCLKDISLNNSIPCGVQKLAKNAALWSDICHHMCWPICLSGADGWIRNGQPSAIRIIFFCVRKSSSIHRNVPTQKKLRKYVKAGFQNVFPAVGCEKRGYHGYIL